MLYRVIFDENSPYWSKSKVDNDEFVRTIQDWAKAELAKNKVVDSRLFPNIEKDPKLPVLYLEDVLRMFDFPFPGGAANSLGWPSLLDVRIYATDLDSYTVITFDGLTRNGPRPVFVRSRIRQPERRNDF